VSFRAARLRALLGRGGAVALAALLAACATTGDIERLEERIADLEIHKQRIELSQAQDIERIEKLHAMLREAEETLRTSGANLGLRLERMEAEMPRIRGDLEAATVQLRRAISDLLAIKGELADRLGSTVFFLPSDLPQDKDGMWKAGEAAAEANNVREAQAIFELYEASFPDDARAPRALWEIARMMERNGDTDEAIRFYQRVFDRHAKSDLAPRAVMRIAELYVIRKDCGRARSIYQFVGKEYRNTDAGREANKRARNVMRECR